MKNLKKFIVIIVVILCFSGCDDNQQMELMTEEQLVEYQGTVLEFIFEDQTFGVNGCYSQYDEESGMNTMYIGAYEEEGVDYEAYKEKIWDAVGVKFNIVFEMIPFPKNPTISGVVREIKYDNSHNQKDYVGTILVVSQTSDFVAGNGNPFYNASYISVNTAVEIVNLKGEKVEFEDLNEGMMIDSYYRGMTMTTYPGLQGTEKLVVHENYDMPMVKEIVDEDTFLKKFNGINYTGPYPVIVEGYSYKMLLDEWRSRMDFYMDSGMIYYDVEDGFNAPKLYTGKLKWTFTGPNDVYETGEIDEVILLADEDLSIVSINEEKLQFELPILEAGQRSVVIYEMSKEGIVQKM